MIEGETERVRATTKLIKIGLGYLQYFVDIKQNICKVNRTENMHLMI